MSLHFKIGLVLIIAAAVLGGFLLLKNSRDGRVMAPVGIVVHEPADPEETAVLEHLKAEQAEALRDEAARGATDPAEEPAP